MTAKLCLRQAYANQMVDHHLILDLLPPLARAYFARRLPASLSFGQAAILAALGLQQRDLDDVGAALGLPANQVLALFNKVPWPSPALRVWLCAHGCVAHESHAAVRFDRRGRCAGAACRPGPCALDQVDTFDPLKLIRLWGCRKWAVPFICMPVRSEQ